LANNAVTSDKIVAGAIMNSDINVSAAIDGTKVDPNFGSQTITGTGNIILDGSAIILRAEATNKARYVLFESKTSTTDNTITTITQLSPQTDSTIDVKATIMAVRNDGATNGSWKIDVEACYSVDNVGNVTEMDTNTKTTAKTLTGPSYVGMDADIYTNGSSIRIRVTGQLATDWAWGCIGSYSDRKID
jgi:hypothetical protein